MSDLEANTEFVVFTEKRQIWRPIRRLIRRLFFHQKVRFRGQLRGCAVHQKRSHHRGRFKGYLEPRKHQNSIVWVARKFIIFTQFGGSTSKMISHQIPSWTRFDSLVFYLFHRFRGRLGYWFSCQKLQNSVKLKVVLEFFGLRKSLISIWRSFGS